MEDFLNNIDFLADDEEKAYRKEIKILIADDNEDVHQISKLILADFSYKDNDLQLLHAYGEAETKEMIKENKDIAIILLDVVMETDSSGLDVVKYIRDDLKNSFVRIILRTGQPGKAPEDEVIREYDINNYIAKTEGSIQKIYTALYAAIRSYTDLVKIDHSKKGLEKVVEASKELYKYSSFIKFYEGILYQLTNLLDFENNSFIASDNYIFSGAILSSDHSHEYILAATGTFEECVNMQISDIFEPETIESIRNQEPGQLSFYDNFYICCWILGDNKVRNYIYIESDREIKNTTKKMIKLVINNFSLAISNFSLNHEIGESQKEMIFNLGDVIETRLRDNHNHIYRVSEISALIAIEYGLPSKEVELLRLISPLHDVGKISIPDDILLKPGKLTDEEYEIMKQHTVKGNKLIKSEKRKIFKVAGEIALYHHEKWSGGGYPEGISGTDIPIFARIVSVADVFDALAHNRCYKKAWSIEKIVDLFENEKGKSFEPKIVDILLEKMDYVLDILDEYPGEV